ncbi:hypothetical protein [Clostridium botulinum]|nr:hypothetical protein [Clostridium botulinum]
MSKLISELDIKIIDEIEYYNTKYIPVANNDKIREKVIEIVRNYRNFYLI